MRIRHFFNKVSFYKTKIYGGPINPFVIINITFIRYVSGRTSLSVTDLRRCYLVGTLLEIPPSGESEPVMNVDGLGFMNDMIHCLMGSSSSKTTSHVINQTKPIPV